MAVNDLEHSSWSGNPSLDRWYPWSLQPQLEQSKPHSSKATSQVAAYNHNVSFFISQAILKSSCSNRSESAFLNLPAEILVMVMQKVQIPYFQVCLALTCKTMARIASKQDILSSWRGYRDKDGLFRLLQRNHWMPTHLRLCRACFRFLPTDRHYWMCKMGDRFDAKDINWYDVFNFFDETSSQQHRCPYCVLNKYVSFVSESFYLEGRYSPGKVEDMIRSICPALHKRIDRP